jgi:hypothetical protein
VLATFAEPSEDRLIQRDVRHDVSGGAGPTGGLRQEVEELGTFGLLGVVDSNGELGPVGSTYESASGIWGAPIAMWRIAAQGRLLVEVARLDDVSVAERDAVLDDLVA